MLFCWAGGISSDANEESVREVYISWKSFQAHVGKAEALPILSRRECLEPLIL